MIIKKPYAFLIKHFRIIHAILSVGLLYLLIRFHSLFVFFNDYVKNGFYTLGNISGGFINFYMFIAIILVLVISLFIYFLMRWKNKSRLYYIFLCLFYLVLFVSLLVYFNLFQNLANTPLDVRVVRAYRDVVVLLYLPQYAFLIFGIIRAIGFDVKKFDFKKDLADLDIAEEDQEEIEVTFGENSYKYKRRARRFLREFKYYFFENKFILIIIGSVLFLVLVVFLFLHFSVYGKTYKVSENFNVDGVLFKVLDAYVSDVDYSGKKIVEDEKYVVVKVNMENTNSGKVNIPTDSLRLLINDTIYVPNYSITDYFRDFGEGFSKNSTLYPGASNNYVFVFDIPKDIKINKAVFRIVDDVNIVNGEIASGYKDVNIKVNNFLLDEKNYQYLNIGDKVELEDSSIAVGEFTVNSYQIADSFTERYTYCVTECYEGSKNITASGFGMSDKTILKVNVDTLIETEDYIKKYLTSSSDFISLFGSVTYSINNNIVTKYYPVKDLDIDTNNVYIEVPKDIKNATEISLDINIRDRKYIITLK